MSTRLSIIPPLIISVVGCLCLPYASSAEGPILSVHAFDAEGTVVEDFQFMLRKEGMYTPWVHSYKGVAGIYIERIGGHRPGTPIECIVSATGYVPTVQIIEYPAGESDTEVYLDTGETIALELIPPKGHQLPESLKPFLYRERHRNEVQAARQWSNRKHFLPEPKRFPDHAVSSESNVYRYRVGEDTGKFYFLIAHENFLHNVELGPFAIEAFRSGPLQVQLPVPSSIQIRLTDSAGVSPPSFETYWVQLLRFMPEDKGLGYGIAGADSVQPGESATFTGISPGTYWVEAYAEPISPDAQAPTMFRDVHIVEIGEGEDIELVSEFVPYDPDASVGRHSLRLNVKRPDGSVAMGLSYSLRYQDFHYGGGFLGEPLAEGTIPESGSVLVEGLTSRVARPERLVKRSQAEGQLLGEPPNYYLVLDDGRYRKAIVVSDATPITELDVVLPPAEGDPAPDIAFVDALDGQEKRLSDWRGQVVFLEFWAIWCGPCQGPMEHNVHLLDEHGAAWAGRAAILPLSIDASVDHLRAHVRNKGWDAISHYWTGEPDAQHDAAAATAFGVSGVPVAFLIDQEGIIRWRGHPTSIDIDAEIEKLLAP